MTKRKFQTELKSMNYEIMKYNEIHYHYCCCYYWKGKTGHCTCHVYLIRLVRMQLKLKNDSFELELFVKG